MDQYYNAGFDEKDEDEIWAYETGQEMPVQRACNAAQVDDETEWLDIIKNHKIETATEGLKLAISEGSDGCSDRYWRWCDAHNIYVDVDAILVYSAGWSSPKKDMTIARNKGATAYDTALLRAAYNTDIKTVKLLLSWGATNLDHALAIISFRGDLQFMDELRQCGASNYELAFQEAVRGADLAAMRMLRDWGACNFDAARCWAAATLNASNDRHAEDHYDNVIRQLERWGRLHKKKLHHIAILEACLALHPLSLPPYVLLEILDLALKPGPLTQIRRVAIIEGVRGSIRIMRPPRQPTLFTT